MAELPLQMEELAFQMAEFDFQAALHITQCNCIFMFSAPTSVSRYSETGSEQALEARLKEVLDAQIALKETVDKAMVRQKYFMMYCMERHVLHGFALRSSAPTHVKTHKFVTSLFTSRQQDVFALLVTSCQQVWNNLLPTCNNLVEIIRLVARLF